MFGKKRVKHIYPLVSNHLSNQFNLISLTHVRERFRKSESMIDRIGLADPSQLLSAPSASRKV